MGKWLRNHNHVGTDFVPNHVPPPGFVDDPTFTPYQKGYVSGVGSVNPYPPGDKRADWNEGFLDRRNGRPPEAGKYYGQPHPLFTSTVESQNAKRFIPALPLGGTCDPWNSAPVKVLTKGEYVESASA